MWENRFHTDAKCVSLPDDKSKGLAVVRPDQESVLVPFRYVESSAPPFKLQNIFD